MSRTSLRSRVQQRVRQLRADRGMTQEMLCQAAGISLDAVSRIENGARAPTLDTLEKLARGLGVPVVHLLEAHAPATPLFPPRVMRLACALAAADDQLQHVAEGVVRALLTMAQRKRRKR